MKKKTIRRFKKYLREIENPKSFFTYKRAKMIADYLAYNPKLFLLPYLSEYNIQIDINSFSNYAKRTGKRYFILWRYK